MNKKIKLNETRLAFKTAQKIGLMTIASGIIGFPGELKKPLGKPSTSSKNSTQTTSASTWRHRIR
jgi:hypothetical protein